MRERSRGDRWAWGLFPFCFFLYYCASLSQLWIGQAGKNFWDRPTGVLGRVAPARRLGNSDKPRPGELFLSRSGSVGLWPKGWLLRASRNRSGVPPVSTGRVGGECWDLALLGCCQLTILPVWLAMRRLLASLNSPGGRLWTLPKVEQVVVGVYSIVPEALCQRN